LLGERSGSLTWRGRLETRRHYRNKRRGKARSCFIHQRGLSRRSRGKKFWDSRRPRGNSERKKPPRGGKLEGRAEESTASPVLNCKEPGGKSANHWETVWCEGYKKTKEQKSAATFCISRKKRGKIVIVTASTCEGIRGSGLWWWGVGGRGRAKNPVGTGKEVEGCRLNSS